MLAVSAALRSKTLVAATLCGLAAPCGGMAAAQGLEGAGRDSGDSGAAYDGAPVIPAPGDPGRSAPSSAYAPTEMGGGQ